MSTTKKVILKIDQRKPKFGYLRLQTISNRKSKEKSLNKKIHTKNWNADKQFVYSTEPNAHEINEVIQNALRERKSEAIEKVNGTSFIEFAEKHLSLIHVKSTRDTKRFALNKLKEYLQSEGKIDILFPEIDLYFIKRYYNYLKDKCKVSTANEYMTNFKYFINQADIHEKFTFKRDPFKNLKKNRQERTHSVMTPSEVESFFAYKPEDKTYIHVQNGFGFMMHAAGLRISDLLNLKWDNFRMVGESYYIEFYMQKTNKLMTPKLTLEALQFLIPFIEDYDRKATKRYQFLKKKNQELVKKLEQYIEEESQIGLTTLSSMKYGVQAICGVDKLFDLIQEEVKKEERKKCLQKNIVQLKASIKFNKKQMVGLLGNEVLRLKDSHPDENVLPHCRHVPRKDYEQVVHAVKQQFNYRLKEIQNKLGIRTRITNHMARHVFAQRLFEAGTNFHHISLALGHKNLETTETYRNKLITDKAKDVVEEFSKIMASDLV